MVPVFSFQVLSVVLCWCIYAEKKRYQMKYLESVETY